LIVGACEPRASFCEAPSLPQLTHHHSTNLLRNALCDPCGDEGVHAKRKVGAVLERETIRLQANEERVTPAPAQ